MYSERMTQNYVKRLDTCVKDENIDYDHFRLSDIWVTIGKWDEFVKYIDGSI